LQREWLGIEGISDEAILAQIEHLEDRIRVLRAALADRQSRKEAGERPPNDRLLPPRDKHG